MPIDPNIPLGASIGPQVDPFKAFDFALRMRQAKRLEEQDAAEAGYRTQLLQSKQQELADAQREREQKQQATQEFNTTMQKVFESGEPSSEAVQRELVKAGRADLFLQIEPHLRGFDEARKKIQDAKLDAAKNIAFTIDKFGNTPEALEQSLLFFKAAGWTDEELAPYLQRAQEDPKSIAFMTSRFAGDKINKEAAGKTREIKTVDEQGNPVIKIVPDEPGTYPERPAALQEGTVPVIRVNPRTGKVEQVGEAPKGSHFVQQPAPPSSGDSTLVKVEHQDPATGRTIIEYLPKGELRGQVFQKGVTGATETRLASAQAVKQTGDDIIAKLSDPKYAATLGPAMGRYSTVQDFIGNPPPEFSEIAGQIESFALANMGVHGMRSAQGAEQIKKLLGQHHTPASLISTIKGLNAFAEHFMQNEGRPVGSTKGGATPAPAGGAPSGMPVSYADYLKGKK